MVIKDYNELPEGLKLLGCFKSDRYQALTGKNDSEEAKEMAKRFNQGEYAISKDGKIYYGSLNMFS